MENATEALMMGFAVLIFVIALTVSITVFSQVREVSDIVLYTTDETNYYDYQGATGKTSENRIVGLETIVPTLYKYYKENYTVIFRQAKYTEQNGELVEIEGTAEPLILYTTESTYKNNDTYFWGKQVEGKNYSTYDLNMYKKYNNYISINEVSPRIFSKVYNAIGNSESKKKEIFSFDLEEETLRREPWTGSNEKIKTHLDAFLKEASYTATTSGKIYKNYGDKSFIDKYANNQFIETVGEYAYNSRQADDTEEENSTVSTTVKAKNKRIIIYTLVKK